MRRLLPTLALLSVAVGGPSCFRKDATGSGGGPSGPTKAKVERGSIVMSVSTTGRVVPNLEVEIKCKASGQVLKIPHDVSDPVRKGALLVELDPVDEKRSVRLAEVALSASRARLAQAKQNLLMAEQNLAAERRRAGAALKSAEARSRDAAAKSERMRELLAKGLTSREESETVETAAVGARADLENARARMEELNVQERALELKRLDVRLAETKVESDGIALSIAKQRLDDTKVYAPMDGVISGRYVQTGQIISSGISNVGGGTRALSVADLSRLYVLASVDESEIGKVRVGQPASITVDAFLDTAFRGEVVRIGTKGVNVSNVITFEVRIEVKGPGKSVLKLEMSANVEIVAARSEDALLVPTEAVSRRRGREGRGLQMSGRRGGRSVTVLRDDGSTEERPVKVGLSDGVRTEVSSGLAEGETVLVNRGEAESRWRRDRPPHGTPFFGRPKRR